MKLVFATHNKNKLKEVNSLMPGAIQLLSLDDISVNDDIPETASTLEGNAMLKAQYVFDRFGLSCFADDSGLEVVALNNEPGVYSARYAGDQKNDKDNIHKLLNNMQGVENRAARFRTVIALIMNGEKHLFSGEIPGTIAHGKQGENGFGYDPVFIPDGYDKSFAQMTAAEKNAISHRAIATQKLIAFLKINS